jgi:predicted subunit of tRNA(5-methylaminomethyl-2-thiouridylate) methyltransferase
MDTLVPILTNSTITTIQKDYIVDHIEAICGSTTKVMDEMITTRSVIEECKKSITTLQNQLTMLEMKMRE